jgi:hypothetical protein
MRRLLPLVGLTLVLLPAASAQETILEATPRQDWRLHASIAEVASFVGSQAGRAVRLDAEVAGRVDLDLRDGTWRDALEQAAVRVGASVVDDGAGAVRLVRFVLLPPLALVPGPVAGDDPAPDPASPPREEAAASPFEWLTSHQESDGSWAVPADAALSPAEGRVAATSLALLVYLGDGITHRFGPFKETVYMGLSWLRTRQDAEGSLCDERRGLAPVLAQALGTQVFCEAYAVSRDITLVPYAKAAVRALCALRQGGGWPLAPWQPANSFATTQAVIALRAARAAGLELPDGVLAEADAWLARATGADGLAGFRTPGDGISLAIGAPDPAPRVPLFTAGAVLGRRLCGTSADDLARGGRQLVLPRRELAEPAYWYLGTYASLVLGGVQWTVWTPAMKAALLPSMEADGSWAPVGLWGRLGGRVVVTAVCELTLQIYDRYERATHH